MYASVKYFYGFFSKFSFHFFKWFFKDNFCMWFKVWCCTWMLSLVKQLQHLVFHIVCLLKNSISVQKTQSQYLLGMSLGWFSHTWMSHFGFLLSSCENALFSVSLAEFSLLFQTIINQKLVFSVLCMCCFTCSWSSGLQLTETVGTPAQVYRYQPGALCAPQVIIIKW